MYGTNYGETYFQERPSLHVVNVICWPQLENVELPNQMKYFKLGNWDVLQRNDMHYNI